MTHSRRQLNREESNAIPNIEGCGACGISHAGCRVMIHAGAIVNMRIGPIYIRKHDRGNNAISRHKGVKARKEGGTEVRQIVVISSRNQLIGLGNRRDDIKMGRKAKWGCWSYCYDTLSRTAQPRRCVNLWCRSLLSPFVMMSAMLSCVET